MTTVGVGVKGMSVSVKRLLPAHVAHSRGRSAAERAVVRARTGRALANVVRMPACWRNSPRSVSLALPLTVQLSGSVKS